MTLAEILAEARRLDEAATKGPWVSERVSTLDYGNGFVASVPAREGDVLCEYAISADGVTHVPAETGQHDATFIAFARTALPRLAAVAEAAVEMRGWLNTGHAYEGGCPDAVEPRSLDTGHCRCCASIVAFDAALRGEGQKP